MTGTQRASPALTLAPPPSPARKNAGPSIYGRTRYRSVKSQDRWKTSRKNLENPLDLFRQLFRIQHEAGLAPLPFEHSTTAEHSPLA